MKKPKVTLEIYCQYLLASFDNFTGSNLADQIGCCHDAVTDFLGRSPLRPLHLWDSVKKHLPPQRRLGGVLIIDDTVLDKRYGPKIESSRPQWSGLTASVINGIGLVNLLHYDPSEGDYLPIDYRIYDPDRDGKTKLDHAQEMMKQSRKRGFHPLWVLIDSWYSALRLLKEIERGGSFFLAAIKSNRKVSLPGQKGVYHRVDELSFRDSEWERGLLVWLKGFGWVLLFRIVRPSPSGTEKIEYLVTNNLDVASKEEAKDIFAYRWNVEGFHRELKQLTGIEFCQARKQRSQRNHILSSMLVWLSLWRRARIVGKTLYQLKRDLLSEYLKKELLLPQIPVFAS